MGTRSRGISMPGAGHGEYPWKATYGAWPLAHPFRDTERETPKGSAEKIEVVYVSMVFIIIVMTIAIVIIIIIIIIITLISLLIDVINNNLLLLFLSSLLL